MRSKTAALSAALAASIVASSAIAGVRAAAPVTSLRTLPAPATLPRDYVRLVEHQAAYVGITRAAAVARTRMLLSNVTGLPLYAFAGTHSRVCFAVWRGGGTCGEVSGGHEVIWLVNGGSRKRGQAVVGVVSDRVRAVDVSIGSRVVHASVRHNAFVVPFRVGIGQRTPMPSVVPITR